MKSPLSIFSPRPALRFRWLDAIGICAHFESFQLKSLSLCVHHRDSLEPLSSFINPHVFLCRFFFHVQLQMLGYDVSWAAFNIVEVMSSSKFTYKVQILEMKISEHSVWSRSVLMGMALWLWCVPRFNLEIILKYDEIQSCPQSSEDLLMTQKN